MTEYEHRLIMIIPAAARTATNNFFKNQIDPDGGEFTFTNGLSPNGSGTPTKYWCSIAVNNEQLRRIMVRLCNLASVPAPSGWASMNRQERHEWFRDAKATIRANTNIRVQISQNNGLWDNPLTERQAEGVQPIRN